MMRPVIVVAVVDAMTFVSTGRGVVGVVISTTLFPETTSFTRGPTMGIRSMNGSRILDDGS